MKISFIGAGNVARSLGALFAKGGHEVTYSSSAPEGDAIAVADAVHSGEVICLALPYAAIAGVVQQNLPALQGKIIVDITNAINIADWSPVLLGQETSGAEEVAKVVKAFNTIFADVMHTDKQVIEGQKLTAFIATDNEQAAATVSTLAKDAGFAPLHTGPLKNARYLEAMAHLNIAIALGGGGTNAGFAYLKWS